MKQKVLDIRCFKFLTSPLGLLTSGWDLKSKRPYIWPLFRRLGALMFFGLYIAHCCLCSESHSLLNWVCEGFKYMQIPQFSNQRNSHSTLTKYQFNYILKTKTASACHHHHISKNWPAQGKRVPVDDFQ